MSHLTTPIYLGAVAVLALNDHLLKQAVPGLITGKLSDFAGLFAFGVFLSVVLRRHISIIHAGVAVAFAAWKSPLSDPLIEAWNATMPYRIGRVVDYSDLLALFVLPLSMVYLRHQWWTVAPRTLGTAAAAAISLVVFAATSQAPDRAYIETGNEYVRNGQYDRAVGFYDVVLKDNPDHAEALYLRGIAKLKLGDTAGGEADIAKAASINAKYRPH